MDQENDFILYKWWENRHFVLYFQGLFKLNSHIKKKDWRYPNPQQFLTQVDSKFNHFFACDLQHIFYGEKNGGTLPKTQSSPQIHLLKGLSQDYRLVQHLRVPGGGG